ncbi:hypothetical protein ACWELB_12240 [Streptomyces asiaticus]|uniref:hypothetical protein n=1 Tax=Streptomyces asiaticus TaxID=114695 RepID=UPI003D704E94
MSWRAARTIRPMVVRAVAVSVSATTGRSGSIWPRSAYAAVAGPVKSTKVSSHPVSGSGA